MRPGLIPITAELDGGVGIPPLTPLVLGAALVVVMLGFLIFGGETSPPAYSLAEVRTGANQVPRNFLTDLPAAVLKDAELAARKDIFVRTVLPLVLSGNEAVQADRARLLDLFDRRDSGEPLTRKERAWLDRLAGRYGGSAADLAALLRRVDVVPASLALTQAAIESAWGTSRFAIDGNALFGLRTSEGAPALVAKGRDDGVAVRRYTRLAGSVGGYIHTLNTHPAYREFRAMRAEMRANGPVAGRALLPTLGAYAEDSNYLELLAKVMRDGRFWEFDAATLDSS